MVPGCPLEDCRPSGFRIDCILQIHSKPQSALVNRVLLQIVLSDFGQETVLTENFLPTLLQDGENCHQKEQDSHTQGGKDHSCIAWNLVSGGNNPGWKVWDGGAVFSYSTIHRQPYLIFVIFSPRTLFLAKIFSTQKRVNRNKPILRQNSVNGKKNTNFETEQFKMQQNTINCTHIEGDFRFFHICHI